tara:strand:+ start:416 stop:1531 length:1116 start_codon:yes stop_codon:yes gene_type:complete
MNRFKNTIVHNTGEESIITNQDWHTGKQYNILKNHTISVIGYGSQGRAQALNHRDEGRNIIVGVRKEGNSWKRALKDGFVKDRNLFPIDEAVSRGTIIKYLLSDTAQISEWPQVKDNLFTNDTLYFSHGFGMHYHNHTHINPPEDIDIIMVSPKCSGDTVRKNFRNERGFVSSYAIYRDYTNTAFETCMALAFSMGNNYVFETTFENETVSDLTGERCILMGMIQAAFSAQYNVLRKNGHSPLEAYHETVYEALNSLYPLINTNGMDWMYKNCSPTAQRGALDWSKRFEGKLEDMVEECYTSVKNEEEVKRVIEKKSSRNELEKELQAIVEQEVWKVHRQVNDLKKDSISTENVFVPYRGIGYVSRVISNH